MSEKIHLLHKLAFRYSVRGFRGSSYVWRFANIFAEEKNGSKIVLPSGFPIIYDRTDWMARTIYEGTYERSLLTLLDQISVKGCLVDVGANIGVTLWHGMQKSYPDATYVAVEPSIQCQKGLELSTNSIDKPGKILKLALGNVTEKGRMHGLNNPKHSGSASLLARDGLNGLEIEVQVRTLDELIQEGEISGSIYLLKIDTEGYEDKVLLGGENLISRSEVRIFILEVSPSFGSTQWVRKLYDQISSIYTFYKLVETGNIRKRTRLIPVDISEAVSDPEQWNLVILHHDLLLNENKIEKMIKIPKVGLK